MSVQISQEQSISTDCSNAPREVIRCLTCGLVQFRTRRGNCRRCVRPLPLRLASILPPAASDGAAAGIPNAATVEKIGQRIRQLRESYGVTQSELQSRSKVSRSYLSRIEGGQMTPSIGTLEKVSEALGVGLNQFFMPEAEGEGLLRDSFIQGLQPFLCQLEWAQWQSVLKRLHAIGAHVNKPLPTLRPIGKQVAYGQPQRRNVAGHIGAGQLEEAHDRLNGHSRYSPPHQSVARAWSKR